MIDTCRGCLENFPPENPQHYFWFHIGNQNRARRPSRKSFPPTPSLTNFIFSAMIILQAHSVGKAVAQGYHLRVPMHCQNHKFASRWRKNIIEHQKTTPLCRIFNYHQWNLPHTTSEDKHCEPRTPTPSQDPFQHILYNHVGRFARGCRILCATDMKN